MTGPDAARPEGLVETDFIRRLGRHIARRVQHAEDSEDILQESVARAFARVRAGILAPRDIEPYAYRIAGNLMIDRVRRAGPPHVELSETLASDTPEPHRLAETREELAAMVRAIERMPPLRRTVFTRVRLDGVSHQDLCAELGISRKAVEKHMTRALADIVEARRKLKQGAPRPAAGRPT